MARAPEELRRYLADCFGALLTRPDFADALTGMIVPDDSLVERVQTVLQRVTLLARAA